MTSRNPLLDRTVGMPSASKPTRGAAVTIDMGEGRLESDAAGFSRLGELHHQLLSHAGCELSINWSRLDWFDGHMAGPMKVVIRHAEAKGNMVIFGRARSNVDTVLRKNGFLPGSILDERRSTIPLKHFSLEEAIPFSNYAKEHLSRGEMPAMSDALVNKFFEGIDELFSNSALHSRSSLGVVVAGQFYRKRQRLDFTMSDGGRGISGSVRATGRNMSDPQAIAWAMQDFHTTRQLDIPGGLGSKILRDFVKLNRGKLVIASNGGFWSQTGHQVDVLRLDSAFPGTAVLLEINTADSNRYDLADAPKPDNIW